MSDIITLKIEERYSITLTADDGSKFAFTINARTPEAAQKILKAYFVEFVNKLP